MRASYWRRSFFQCLLAIHLILLLFALTAHAGFLYVLNDDPAGSRIYGFEVNETTGALTALAGFPVLTGGNGGTGLVCERMTLDTVNRRLFVVNDNSDSVSAYSIELLTGALTPMPFSPVLIGAGTWNAMAVHPSGSPLIISNGATGGGAVSLNITATTATPAAGSPFSLGAATAFSNTFNADGTYYYTGGNTGANIAGFSVNPSTGVLTPTAGSPHASGATGPLAYAMDSSGRLFVLNTDFGIRIFTTIGGIGVPTPVTGNPFPSGLTQRRDGLLHRNGSFYIVAGNTGNNVGVFQISGSGSATTVAAVPGSPFATGGTTANVLALNEAGTFLFVGNRLSRNVSTFTFNPSTGVLGAPTVQASNTMGTTGAVNGMAYFAGAVAVAGNIGGRIVDTNGQGVRGVIVRLTSMDGTTNLRALTNGFGYYSFPSVTTGVTYTLTPLGKGYTFTPPSITFSHTGDVTNHDFVGQQN